MSPLRDHSLYLQHMSVMLLFLWLPAILEREFLCKCSTWVISSLFFGRFRRSSSICHHSRAPTSAGSDVHVNNPNLSYNRKCFHSFINQVVVDHHKTVAAASIMFAGNTYDTFILGETILQTFSSANAVWRNESWRIWQSTILLAPKTNFALLPTHSWNWYNKSQTITIIIDEWTIGFLEMIFCWLYQSKAIL